MKNKDYWRTVNTLELKKVMASVVKALDNGYKLMPNDSILSDIPAVLQERKTQRLTGRQNDEST